MESTRYCNGIADANGSIGSAEYFKLFLRSVSNVQVFTNNQLQSFPLGNRK